MADTCCDLKVSLGIFSQPLGEAEVSSVPPLESLLSTSSSSERQAAADAVPALVASTTTAATRLADSAYGLHRSANGSTVSWAEGNMVGRQLFAISIYPERSVKLRTPPTWQNIFAFVLLNLDLLVKRGYAFGSWFDRPDAHVLDVVLLLPDRRTALELGRAYGQKSIYDLAAKREIAIRPKRIRDGEVHVHQAACSNPSKRPLREFPRTRKTKVIVR